VERLKERLERVRSGEAQFNRPAAERVLGLATPRTAEVEPNPSVVQDISTNVDRSVFIEASLKEVGIALGISLTLVLGVIYLFLGNVRATLVPAVTIPVSIIAAFVVMAALGFSINTLTLLGLVLAIGLVVDDAIVVLENIYRRIEQGEPALIASVDGTREIGFAVIATTGVLVAVFLPMSFLQGNVGKLFREFGFTIAAAVLFSALSRWLTPMMFSPFCRRSTESANAIEHFFAARGHRPPARHAAPWLVIGGTLVAVALQRCCAAVPANWRPRTGASVIG
jgi:multidrug efflux pump